jgi:hypothetical protein
MLAAGCCSFVLTALAAVCSFQNRINILISLVGSLDVLPTHRQALAQMTGKKKGRAPKRPARLNGVAP